MNTEEKLKRIFSLLVEAVKGNANLSTEIERVLALGAGSTPAASKTRGSLPRNRRRPAAFDPFVVYEEGEAKLRARLAELDLEALRDIVAEHRMDPAKLVRKWKARERVLDHIVSTVQARSKKGDAFRG